MLPISSIAIAEKNKLASDGVWLVLLDVDLANETETAWALSTAYTVTTSYVSNDSFGYQCIKSHTSDAAKEPGVGASWQDYWRVIHVRLVYNDENITWDSETWTAFPFDVEEIRDRQDGQVPRVAVKVSNINSAMESIVEATGGGVGATVRLYIVLDKNVASSDPEVELHYSVRSCSKTAQWVTFVLGGPNYYYYRFPRNRLHPDICRFKFKDYRCGYAGGVASCDQTLASCQAKSNDARYGGMPGIQRAS